MRKAPTVKRLRDLCFKYQPDLLFVQETKCTPEKMPKWKKLCLFYYSYFVNPDGTKGGLGDFNQVGTNIEKLSKCRNIPGSKDMTDTINDIGLIDLKSKGNWFTWTNGRQGDDSVWERLDKSFRNLEWIRSFPDTKRQFKFEAMWLQHPQFHHIVRQAWNKPTNGSRAIQLKEKIKSVSKDIWSWNKSTFGNLNHQINQAYQEVEYLQKHLHSQGQRDTEFVARKRMEFLQKCDEIRWAQRANQLCIHLSNGNWTSDDTVIKQEALDFFKALYTSHDVAEDNDRMEFIRSSGRLIQDNILIASEIMHYIKGCKRTKQGWATMKVDLNKAYDKISWKFLRDVLNYMNFPPLWQQILMECVSTVSMNIKINGESTNWFSPTAGLRQGDPLSPYLYVLCANVLSHHLSIAQEKKKIRGIKIGRETPTINHLMYADDILLFFKADKKTSEEVGRLFQKFGEMTGLWMNHQKTEIKFSPNISNEGKRALTNIFQCKNVDHLGKYLGGFIDGANTQRRNASLILDNLQQHLTGWKAKMLSQAARTTLIKAVVSAVPIYHMQHTWLSHSDASKCDTIMRKFFWGHWDDKRTPTMISWKRMCCSQEKGGMGFRQTKKFNEALLAKQVWRILTQDQTLLSKVFMAKYRGCIQNYDFKSKNSSSYLWKKLCQVSEVVTKNLGWKVGNGRKIYLKDRKWFQMDCNNHNFSRLNDLMLPGGFWDSRKVAQVYHKHNADLVLDTVISHTNGQDNLIWKINFNVRKAYELITEDNNNFNTQRYNWKRVWNLPLPYKTVLFWWKTLNCGLPLRANLAKRGLNLNTSCPFDCSEEETEEHLFKECQFSRSVWLASRLNLRIDDINHNYVLNWIHDLMKQRVNDPTNHHPDIGETAIAISYNAVDGIRENARMKDHDYFFNIDEPRRPGRRHDPNTRTDNLEPHINCYEVKNRRTQRKVITLKRNEGGRESTLCHLVTDFNQNLILATLRCIRLFLESLPSQHSEAIRINIPNITTANYLQHNSKAPIRFQTILSDICNICTNRNVSFHFQDQQATHNREGEASNWPIGWYPIN
ncbi:ribonuclease H [Senna tora]|uniref:Ribonuclease H n=1 Tax=Senna tora TaxID=362788 RepID=A0A835CJF6_9FABA|nr:ribonuclease H [Senna tora]